MGKSSRLDKVLESAFQLDVDDASRIILFSDQHRGRNTWADDFADNANIFLHALKYYCNAGFTYIEVGDGEELWENRNFSDIREAYRDIYWQMEQFLEKGGLFLVWGNHNQGWKKAKNVARYLAGYKSEHTGMHKKLFGDIEVHEGIRLLYTPTGSSLFVTHGHQGELLNDRLWKLGRFLVRYFWGVLQLTGVKDPFSRSQSNRLKGRFEEEMQAWATSRQTPIIAGHTHRAWFPMDGAPAYFNTGSCVSPRCITGIEIEGGRISLVQWCLKPDSSSNMQVALTITKEVLYLHDPDRRCAAPLEQYLL